MKADKAVLGGWLVAAGAVLLPAETINAQEVGGIAAIEEVVVTAKRRAQSLQEVPVSVTAFGQDDIDNLNIQDLRDFEGFAPNVIIDDVGAAASGAAIVIRGIGFQDLERTFEPAVGLMVDEVILPSNSGAILNGFDFERVEILRGPQGILFGKNTTGGLIKVDRTEPTGEWGFKSQITYGRFEQNDWEAVMNFPEFANFKVKVAAATFNDSGFAANAAPPGRNVGRPQVEETNNFNTAILWEPTENFNAKFTFDAIRENGTQASLQSQPLDDGGGQPFAISIFGFQPDPDPNVVSLDGVQGRDDFDFDSNTYTLEANYSTDLGTFTSVTGYIEVQEITYNDFDGSPFSIFGSIRPQTDEQFTQEVRFTSELNGPINFITGAFYQNREFTLNQTNVFGDDLQAVLPGVFPPEQFQNTSQETEGAAGFANVDYDITEDLTLSVGGRFIWEEKVFSTEFPGVIPERSFSESWTEFTPSASLDWQANENLLLFASWSEGFKSGGFPGRCVSLEGCQPYAPEKVSAIEVGAKSDWLDNRLRANLSMFRTDFENQQVELIIPNPIAGTETLVLNAQEIDIKGIELEMQAVPAEGLTLSGNLALLDADYAEFTIDPAIAGLAGLPDNDLSNRTIRRTPDFTYTVRGNYAYPVLGGNLVYDVSWRWTREYETDTANAPNSEIPAHGILDMALAFEREGPWGGNYRFTAFVENLNDRVFFQTLVDARPVAVFRTGSPPRRWGLELNMEF